MIKRKIMRMAARLLVLLLAMGMVLPVMAPVQVLAEELEEALGPTYIGTIGSRDNLTFAHGVGYKIYRDYTDNGVEDDVEFLGAGETSKEDFIFYVVPDTHYSLWSVTLYDEGLNVAIADPDIEIINNKYAKVTVPAKEMGPSRYIKVTINTAVAAYGGQILENTSAAQVAQMFDASYDGSGSGDIIITNNVTVVKSEEQFTVTLTNNILLDGSYYGRTAANDDPKKYNNISVTQAQFEYSKPPVGTTVSLGKPAYHGIYLKTGTLQLLSAGDYTIKRDKPDDFTGNMFIGDAGSRFIFGSGSVSNNTVTYFYSSGKTYTKEITGDVLEPDEDERKREGITTGDYIINAVSNAHVMGTMAGTLTIDGGTDLKSLPYLGDQFTFRTGRYNQGSSYQAGEYNTGNNSTNPEHYANRNDLSLVHSVNGEVQMWPNVIMQNNKSCNRDNTGSKGEGAEAYNDITYAATAGGAINISGDGAAFYMYGGVISDMVNNQSVAPGSDGGAIAANEGAAKIYLYGGEITRCEAQHGGAIEMWNTPGATLAIFNTHIHHNLSLGDGPSAADYPAATIATYALQNAKLPTYIKMFGGVIAENQNKKTGGHNTADICLYSYTQAVINMYGGTVNEIACGAQKETVPKELYIYSAAVDHITWGTFEQTWVHYPANNKLFSVTIPNAVHASGKVTVHATAVKEGVTYSNITGTGTATSADLTMQLPNGTYTVTVTSPSMVKTYTASVENGVATVTPVSRDITEVTLADVTADSVTLGLVGTDNATADGIAYYGFSSTDSTTGIDWYYVQDDQLYLNGAPYTGADVRLDLAKRTITFYLVYGPRYYFVKVGDNGDGFAEDISEGLFVKTKNAESVVISPGRYNAQAGSVVHFSAMVHYSDQTSDSNVKWSFVGGTSSSTTLTQNGALHVSTEEQAQPILQTLTEEVSGAKPLVFENDVYTVPEGGLAYGCYYIEEADGTRRYFYTTSKLLAGDRLTWNSTNKTVKQSANHIVVTAVSAIDAKAYAEAIWTQAQGSGDAKLSQVTVLLNGQHYEQLLSFGDVTATEENGFTYQHTAQVNLIGAEANDDVYLNVVPVETTALYEIAQVYSYTLNGNELVFGSDPILYSELDGFALPEGANGVMVYINVYPEGNSDTTSAPTGYRLQMVFNQHENYWISHPSCPPVALGELEQLNPFAESLHGSFQYRWENGQEPDTAGQHNLIVYVESTPLYQGLEKTVSVTVYDTPRTQPNVAFSGTDSLSLVYGQALNDIDLNDILSAGVEGSFAWVDGAIEPTVADNSRHIRYPVVFTPGDENLSAVVEYVTVHVEKADVYAYEKPTAPVYNGQSYQGKPVYQTDPISSFDPTGLGGRVTLDEAGTIPISGTWMWYDESLRIVDHIGQEVDLIFVPDSGNYNTVIVKITIKIRLEVCAENQSITYTPGYTLDQTKYTIVGTPHSGDSIDVSLSLSGETVINPTVTVRDEDGNVVSDVNVKYDIALIPGTFTLIPAASELEFGTLIKNKDVYTVPFRYTGAPVDSQSELQVTVTAVNALVSLSDEPDAGTDVLDTTLGEMPREGEYPALFVRLNEGAASITVTVEGTAHYESVTRTLNLTDTFIITAYNGVYDGEGHGITASRIGSDEEPTITYYTDDNRTETMTERELPSNVGVHSVYYKVEVDGASQEGTAEVTITQRPVTITWENLRVTYDGTEHEPGFTCDGILVSHQYDLFVELVENAQTNAGSYPYHVEFTGNMNLTDNYKLNNASETLVIEKATPTLDRSIAYEPVYIGQVQSHPSWSLVLCEGDTGTPNFRYEMYVNGSYRPTSDANGGAETSFGPPKNAGSYRVTVTYDSTENYEALNEVYEFEVKKRSLTIIAPDQFATNGGSLAANTNDYVVEGEQIPGHDLSVTVSGAQNGVGESPKVLSNPKVMWGDTEVTENYEIRLQNGRLVVSAVLTQQGAVRNELESTTPATEMKAGEAVTASFAFAYTQNGYGALVFHFASPLPNGTKLTLLDLCEGHSAAYYYYIVTADDITSIDAVSFKQMGSSVATGPSCNSAKKQWQLIVDLPENAATGSLSVELKQGEKLLSSIQPITILPAAVFDVTQNSNGADAGRINATVQIEGSPESQYVLAVQLLKADGTLCVFPAGSMPVLKAADGTSYTPVKMSGELAFFAALPKGTYTVTLDMGAAHIAATGDTTYRLKVIVCENPGAPEYPMAEKIKEGTLETLVVQPYVRPCLALQTGVERHVTTAITFDVSYIGTPPAGTELEYTVDYKAGTGSNPTPSQSLENKIVLTGTQGKKTVTVTGLSEVPKGIYLITFTYGEAKCLFAFVVY